ncbi:hypothetical protein FF36_06010 [Frankia torreyi]|uniref:Uncharacterized protein n=1 Tax=Frankia torreyi TaxID=1856 RepID=A0A0D8B8L6_9ACTN|nr:hypothetical protein FF36_06010 [Frankia torreyi]KQM02616.1 hypothetical protein FF86_10607 [Frankia sp. CpI1-P]
MRGAAVVRARCGVRVWGDGVRVRVLRRQWAFCTACAGRTAAQSVRLIV